MDGRNPLVTGYYRKRADAILRCGLVAKRFGYRVFAVQHQGWCATGPRAHLTYRKYGRSSKCRNGKGGPWANDVYRVYGKENKPDVLNHELALCNWIQPISLGSHLFLKRPLLGLNVNYEHRHDFVVSTGNPLGDLLGWVPIRGDVAVRSSLIGYNFAGPVFQIWIIPRSD